MKNCRYCWASYKSSTNSKKNIVTKDDYNLAWTNDEWYQPPIVEPKELIGFCQFCDRNNKVWYNGNNVV